jgi:hypothetical protein
MHSLSCLFRFTSFLIVKLFVNRRRTNNTMAIEKGQIDKQRFTKHQALS